MNLGCIINPDPCLHAAADGLLSVFPFGLYGLVFLAGMVIGERIGLWGIIAAVSIWLVARFGTKSVDRHEHVSGVDAAPPVRKPRPTIFSRKK